MIFESIEQFPFFSKLDISIKPEIEAYTNRFEPYSDFNFTSLYCWNTDGKTELSTLNNNLVIKLTNYTSSDTIYSILGNQLIDESLDLLLEHCGELSLVPEVVLKNIKNSDKYSVTEDLSSNDYIYDLADLSILSGNNFKKKRNKVHQVSRDIGSALKMIVINDPNNNSVKDIAGVLKKWSIDNPGLEKYNDHEMAAIRRLLSSYKDLDIRIFGFYLDSEMVGFSINEKLENDYAICHFEKAVDIHENIYTYISNRVSQELLTMRCKLVNWEQDLGISGLRNSKLTYQPCKFLRKYYVRSTSGTS